MTLEDEPTGPGATEPTGDGPSAGDPLPLDDPPPDVPVAPRSATSRADKRRNQRRR
ncbi:MAG TPA: hypothetical protein VK659_30590 [Asanoa sp.]|nr:hypothetical protein [Asanoa sp.]